MRSPNKVVWTILLSSLLPMSMSAQIAPQKLPAGENVDGDSQYELLPGEDPQDHLGFSFVKHLADDQRAFWLAPVHFRARDLPWIVPFAGATAGFIASDSWMSRQIPQGKIDSSKKFSNYATLSLVGAGAGSFFLGHL